jgi:hypothetical protein
MNLVREFVPRHAAKIATGCVVLALCLMTIPSADKLRLLAGSFLFEKSELVAAPRPHIWKLLSRRDRILNVARLQGRA